MTFIADPETGHVHDPERGLELIHINGGSDGRYGMALVGPDFRCEFDAYRGGRPAIAAELKARPDLHYTVVWELAHAGTIPGLTRYETYRLIGEAVLAKRKASSDSNWVLRLPVNLKF